MLYVGTFCYICASKYPNVTQHNLSGMKAWAGFARHQKRQVNRKIHFQTFVFLSVVFSCFSKMYNILSKVDVKSNFPWQQIFEKLHTRTKIDEQINKSQNPLKSIKITYEIYSADPGTELPRSWPGADGGTPAHENTTRTLRYRSREKETQETLGPPHRPKSLIFV